MHPELVRSDSSVRSKWRARISVLFRAGILATAAVALTTAGCRRRPAPPNIVLVVVDSLRADVLGCYGAERSVSPHIDRIAAQGLRFERTVAPASWNVPSLSSLISSSRPHEHGQGARADSRPDLATLAEALGSRGYQTAAFVESQHKTFLERGFGRFDITSGPFPYGNPQINSAVQTIQAALQWMPASGKSPFFLLIHTYEAHNYFMGKATHRALAKRERPEYFGRFLEWGMQDTETAIGPRIISDLLAASPEDVAFVRSLYRGSVAETDAAIGLLDAQLAEKGLTRNTVLIVTSTNGEGFRPDLKRVHHGGRLHDDLLRVPLIIRWPGRIEPDVARTLASSLDIAPTLLTLVGDAPESRFRGRALLARRDSSLPLIGKTRFTPVELSSATAVAEESAMRVLPTGEHQASILRQAALYSDGVHLIDSGESIELYDIRSDPNEEQNVAQEQASAVFSLCAKLQEQTHGAEKASDESGSPTNEMLKSLGYLSEDPLASPPVSEQPAGKTLTGCERVLGKK
jgi:choline-sulfatase